MGRILSLEHMKKLYHSLEAAIMLWYPRPTALPRLHPQCELFRTLRVILVILGINIIYFGMGLKSRTISLELGLLRRKRMWSLYNYGLMYLAIVSQHSILQSYALDLVDLSPEGELSRVAESERIQEGLIRQRWIIYLLVKIRLQVCYMMGKRSV